MIWRRFAAITVALGVLGHSAPARAQRPPGKRMLQAFKLYEMAQYHRASVIFHEIVEGKTGDDKPSRQRAEFWLGKTLYHLGLRIAALSVFTGIALHESVNPYGEATLRWLAALARELPERSDATNAIGRYRPLNLSAPQLRRVRDELTYYLGEYHYQRGLFSAALPLFRSVGAQSPFYLRAKLKEGMAHVRQSKAKQAAAAFKAVLRATRGKPISQERTRLVELALLSLARLSYSSGRYKGAIKYYAAIPPTSRYREEALFEQSWAYFRSGAPKQALKNLRAVQIAWANFHAEAALLAAAIYHDNCLTRQSQEALKRFQTRFSALRSELSKMLNKYSDPVALYEHLARIWQKTPGAHAGAVRVVRAALAGGQFRRHADHLREIDRQLKLVRSAPASWKAAPIAGQVLQDLTLQRSLKMSAAGSLARARIQREELAIRYLQKQGRQLAEALGKAPGSTIPPGCNKLGNTTSKARER